MNVEHHEVVINPDAETVRCKLCDFALHTSMWSRNLVRRLAHAHAADPSASTVELLEFVAGTDGNGVAGEPRTEAS